MNISKMMCLIFISFSATFIVPCSIQADEIQPKGNLYAKFYELPITDIKPEGWLRHFLENQRDGLTGHLEVAGYPFNTAAWSGVVTKEGRHKEGYWLSWWPYEQTGYWIDGMIRCGYLLGDDFLIQKARKHIEYVLSNPDDKGILGPKHIRMRWPHAVFFRAMIADYYSTKDRRILDALVKHYLAIPAKRYAQSLAICNIEELGWLYWMTGDKRFADIAVKAYKLFCERERKKPPATTLEQLLSDKKIGYHGATFFIESKLPAILYMCTGEKKYLDASINGFRKVDRDHMLIDGVPSSNEHFAGKNHRVCHETCDIVGLSWAAGYMLMATGQAEWADKIERATFNAGIGAVTKDFKAHQYFSCPNQMLATSTSSHSPHQLTMMSFRPGHFVECCSGNINRLMPNYVSRMWLSDGDGGVVSAQYGPCTLTTKAGKDKITVNIIEKTDYPFSEVISFEIQPYKKVFFPLFLRIPGWCKDASILVNGRPTKIKARSGSFAKVERTFLPGDIVELILPMRLKISYWEEDGIGIERGPLVYSYPIKEERKITKAVSKSNYRFPAWEMTAAGPWNYALSVDANSLENAAEIIHRPMAQNPWTVDGSPTNLKVPACKVKNWTLQQGKDDGTFKEHLFVPHLPDSIKVEPEIEEITLVPYGCTCLRLTIFPYCKKR